jgi:hypothetical protein
MLVAWLLIAPVIAVVLSPALGRRHRRTATRSTGGDRATVERREPR